jgi:hypothetical protein
MCSRIFLALWPRRTVSCECVLLRSVLNHHSLHAKQIASSSRIFSVACKAKQHILSFPSTASHNNTLLIPLLRLPGFLALLNLGNHSFESFPDILVVARARFRETATQLFGQFLAVC